MTGNQRTLPRTKLLQQLRKHRQRGAFRGEEERRARLVAELQKARLTGVRFKVPAETMSAQLGRRLTGPGRLREGAKSYAKDTDGNYLATCHARQPADNGLGLGAVGNFISITVLSVSRCPSVGARPAVFSGQVDVFPSEPRDVGQEFGRVSRPASLLAKTASPSFSVFQ